MKYDIFISYRREGGYDTAKHLNDLLVRDGYKVSFDIDTLRNGDFDIQLLERIEQCKDFILIVDEHAFDRTLDPTFDPKKDWLRCELAHALKHKKNIIPVFLSGISGFPDGLPDDVAGVSKKNGPEYNKYYFNEFYKQLCSRFIKSWSVKRKIFIGIFVLITLFCLSYFVSFSEEDIQYINPLVPQITTKKNLEQIAYSKLKNVADTSMNGDSIATWSYCVENANRDSHDQMLLGLCYVIGYGCTPNFEKAVELFTKSAQQDLAYAKYLLGVCYSQGIGVRENERKALNYYREAANDDILEAQNDYGIICGLQNNVQEAYIWLTKAAEQGYAPAQYSLGAAMSGQRNIDGAIYWMEQSAENGYVLAGLFLADVYIFGLEEYRDIEEGLEILDELVIQGNPMAQYALATCYNHGIGVTADFDKALELMEKSASQEFAFAMTDLAGWYCSGTPKFSQDYHKAMELFLKAADQGYPLAQYQIGIMYANGWGVKKNTTKADRWFKKAAYQGFDQQSVSLMQNKVMDNIDSIKK